MKKGILVFSAVVFLFSILSCVLYAQDSGVIVIANNDVAQEDVSAKDLESIFLGKKKSWAGGARLTPFTLSSGNTHESFLKAYVKKSASQYSTFWKQAIFTGQGIPPKSAGSEEEIVKMVSETPGAVGYISSATAHDGVKVLSVK